MSALGQKRTCAEQNGMSALPRKRTCAVQREMSALGQKRTLNQGTWVSNQAPLATKAIPAIRGTSRLGTSFSTNTNAARAAIQKRFMTPATNKSAIKAQQQPMQ